MTQADEWLKEPCIPCKGDGYYITPDGFVIVPAKGPVPEECKCPACQGTGYRHHWAWERCPGIYIYATCDNGVVHAPRRYPKTPPLGEDKPCGVCDGSGWVLAVTLEKVLDYMVEQDLGFELDWVLSDTNQRLCILNRGNPITGKGSTFLAAALDALRQVED